MAFSRGKLSESAERLWEDAFRAGSRYDLAWAANEFETFREKLNRTYEAHAYRAIFNSLISDATMSLLRLLDNQRGTASILNFLRASNLEDIRTEILEGISDWPMHKFKHPADIVSHLDSELEVLILDYSLLKRFQPSLRRMRNQYLAHSNLNFAKTPLPTFSDLCISCRLGELCADRIYVLCTGSNRQVSAFRRVHMKYAGHFWHTMAVGLSVEDRGKAIGAFSYDEE